MTNTHMKSLLLMLLLCTTTALASNSATQENAALAITSDSSVGLRAFQGQSGAEGKIVLKNAGDIALKNIQLNPVLPNDSVALSSNDCNAILPPGKSCSYSVHYQPRFKIDDTDKVSDQFITFLAIADGKVFDDYTMDLQAVANESWVYKGDIYFVPDSGAKVAKISKGSMEILYTIGRMLNGDPQVIRSTDAINWSKVGSIDPQNFSPIGDGLSLANNSIFIDVLTNNKQVAIAQYYQGKWDLLPAWSKVISSDALEESLLRNMDLLAAENGNLYVGLLSGMHVNMPPVLKFDGQKWISLDKKWSWGGLNRLKQYNSTIYAATAAGVAKLDGDQWKLLGNSNPSKNQMSIQAKNIDSIKSAKDILQTPDGDLYASTDKGIFKYNFVDNNWSIFYKNSYDDDTSGGDILFSDKKLYACIADGVLQVNLANGDRKMIGHCTRQDAFIDIFLFNGSLYGNNFGPQGGGGIFKYPNEPSQTILPPKKGKGDLPDEIFLAIQKNSPLYEISSTQIIKKEGSRLTALLSGNNFGNPKAALKFANDFFSSQGQDYVAWGDYNYPANYGYALPDVFDTPMINSRIKYASNEKSQDSDDSTSPSQGASRIGGISQYHVNHWQSVGQESWDQQQLGAAIGVQVIHNIIYAAYQNGENNYDGKKWQLEGKNAKSGVVKYDGKNWLPVGNNTFPAGDFNILQMNNTLYLSQDNCGATNWSDCVFYYQFFHQ